MKLLVIDTTTDRIALALYTDGNSDCFIGDAGSKKHNSMLLTNIDEFLTKNGTKLQDIDVFGVNIGPGSFTGIRIGVATVNAFSLALNKPIVEVTALEQCHDEETELVLLDCTHGYYGGYFTSDAVNYFALSKIEAECYDCKITHVVGVYPEKLLEKCLKKAESGEFVSQARPLYIKDSSAVVPQGLSLVPDSISVMARRSDILPSLYPLPAIIKKL